MLVPPPIPFVISTFKFVFSFISKDNISPNINCSVIGFVAILIVSVFFEQPVINVKAKSDVVNIFINLKFFIILISISSSYIFQ
ncbi:hypothetical protein D3C73_1197200 [compost metagenome]